MLRNVSSGATADTLNYLKSLAMVGNKILTEQSMFIYHVHVEHLYNVCFTEMALTGEISCPMPNHHICVIYRMKYANRIDPYFH